MSSFLQFSQGSKNNSFPKGARTIKLQWHHKLGDQFQIEISNVSKHSKK